MKLRWLSCYSERQMCDPALAVRIHTHDCPAIWGFNSNFRFSFIVGISCYRPVRTVILIMYTVFQHKYTGGKHNGTKL